MSPATAIATATRLVGTTHTEPGAYRNEDSVALNGYSGIVVDGASGVGDDGWNLPGSAAQWFSGCLAQILSVRLCDPWVPITDALAEASTQLRAEWTALSSSPAEAGPSGAVAGVRMRADDVELFTLGDCTTLVELVDGSVDLLHDLTVPRLDAAMVEEMVQAARRLGVRIPEARPAVKDRICRQRRTRNTPGGYWIADLTGAGSAHVLTARYPADRVRRIAIMSDGFAVARTWFPNAHDLLDQMEFDLAAVAGRIRAEYAADPDFERYHRAKMIDDMTALLVRVS